MKTKSLFTSKTAVVNLAVIVAGALASQYPAAYAVMQANPDLIPMVLAAVNIGLRFITSGKMTLFGK